MIMKTLNRIYILAAALLSAAPGLLGQNFNPTVEVTNVYQGDASDIHKPQLEMAVPDSLLRFDLDFDYEVFDKAYRGAYNFSPYMLDMRPEKDAWRGRTLFLRAGAGYSLHPDAAFVFSPSLPGRFQMSVYGDHRSYFGNFADIGVHSLRMGNVVGIHEIHICTDTQTLTLRHEAQDRALFAEGALTAAKWIVEQKPGMYDMETLLAQILG